MELSLEDVKKAAEGGNARAMGMLADYYWENKHPGEACHWYLSAAEGGDEQSYPLAAHAGVMVAHAQRKISGGDAALQSIETLTKAANYANMAGIPSDDSVYMSIHEEMGINWYYASLHAGNGGPSESDCWNQAKMHLLSSYSSLSWEGKAFLAFTYYDELDAKGDLSQDDSALLMSLLRECASSEEGDAHPDICLSYLGILSLGPVTRPHWRYGARDDEAAYGYFIRAEQKGFDCSKMLSSFKKKLFGGHVFVG